MRDPQTLRSEGGGEAPLEPVRPVAPGTHPTELRRLARQERGHPDCNPLAVQTMLWLFRAYSAAINAQMEALRPLGLSPSAFNVLMILVNHPDKAMEPHAVAKRLLISRASMTGLLDTLEAKGLINRTPHPGDGRRILIVLTAKGHSVIEGHYATHHRLQNEFVADLNQAEQEQLVVLLRRLKGAVPEHLSGVPPDSDD